jgi:hypothetical protein
VVASWQRGVSVIAALVVVVLDVEAAQFRVFDAQRAARVVNILSVQRLQREKVIRNDVTAFRNEIVF